MSAATLCLWQNSNTQAGPVPDSTTSPTATLTPASPPPNSLRFKNHFQNKNHNNNNNNNYKTYYNNNNSNNNKNDIEWEMQSNGIYQPNNKNIIVLDDNNRQRDDQHFRNVAHLRNCVRHIASTDVYNNNSENGGNNDNDDVGKAFSYDDHVADLNNKMMVDQEVARSHQLLRNCRCFFLLLLFSIILCKLLSLFYDLHMVMCASRCVCVFYYTVYVILIYLFFLSVSKRLF